MTTPMSEIPGPDPTIRPKVFAVHQWFQSNDGWTRLDELRLGKGLNQKAATAKIASEIPGAAKNTVLTYVQDMRAKAAITSEEAESTGAGSQSGTGGQYSTFSVDSRAPSQHPNEARYSSWAHVVGGIPQDDTNSRVFDQWGNTVMYTCDNCKAQVGDADQDGTCPGSSEGMAERR